MIEIRVIDQEHKQDIRTPNEPFTLWGRMIPSCQNGIWSHHVAKWPAEDIREMCFPDEDYDYDALIKDHTFVGAYDGETCIGLAVLAQQWFKYMYLEDLKVCKAYRDQGVGKALIEKAVAVACENNYNGIYTIGQDNNLSACLFYLKTGFEIGGFDNRVYRGTAQEEKADIIFYKEKASV